MTIEREGTSLQYRLIVNGVNIGEIKKVRSGGGGRGRDVKFYTAWRIHGAYTGRAVTFGYIQIGGSQ
jgi:hypothetical protein